MEENSYVKDEALMKKEVGRKKLTLSQRKERNYIKLVVSLH